MKLFKIRNKETGGWLWGTRGIKWVGDASLSSYTSAKSAHAKRRELLRSAQYYAKRDGEKSALATEYMTAYEQSEVVCYTLSDPEVVDA